VGIIDFVAQWHDTILAIANIFIAIGTLVLAIGIPYAIKGAGREERDTFYATLDRTYFDIQKLVIEYPHLSQPNPTNKTPEEVIQYDAFAYAIWNFIEAIYDYSKEEKYLAETWGCVLQHEAAVHGLWFMRPENRKKFKAAFVEHIERGGHLPVFSDRDS
jgi:hypothetical protein